MRCWRSIRSAARRGRLAWSSCTWPTPSAAPSAPGDDADDARYFCAGHLPQNIGFRTHREALALWARAKAIVCREAVDTDITRLADLGSTPGALGMDALAGYVGARNLALFCAFQGDTPVGYVALALPADELARLEHVFVAPNHRRFGIGTRLLRESVSYMAQRGSHTTHVEAPADHPALPLIIRAGFRVCGYRADVRERIVYLSAKPGRSDTIK